MPDTSYQYVRGDWWDREEQREGLLNAIFTLPTDNWLLSPFIDMLADCRACDPIGWARARTFARNGYFLKDLELALDGYDRNNPILTRRPAWLIEDESDHSQPARRLKVTPLNTVKPERVDFLWRPYIPLGRPVALEGDPGVGKSSLTSKIIAHVTTGKAFPNVIEGGPPLSDFPPRNVCLFTSEDDPADTLLPRIAVNGGDCKRVYLIDGWEQPDGEQGIVTLRDLALIKQVIETYQPILIIFDPLQSFFGRSDMNKANDTRPVLDGISTLCRQYDCTPLYVRHIGKTRRDAIHAGLGSIDIVANMRSALFLGTDPDNPLRRIIGHSKANNSERGQSLAYRIESVVDTITTPSGESVEIEAPRLLWDGLSNLSANDLSSPSIVDEEEKSALDQAREFLVELLEDGPVLSGDIQKASKDSGFSWATIKRAKALAGIKARQRKEAWQSARGALWEWYQPEDDFLSASPNGTSEMRQSDQSEICQQNQSFMNTSRLSHVSNSEMDENNQQNQLLSPTVSSVSFNTYSGVKPAVNGEGQEPIGLCKMCQQRKAIRVLMMGICIDCRAKEEKVSG